MNKGSQCEAICKSDCSDGKLRAVFYCSLYLSLSLNLNQEACIVLQFVHLHPARVYKNILEYEYITFAMC